ncbi:MFS transporter [Variovorax sp. J22P271]|uniref:MFS transporter n=1 Tax=Variovorax davisae TaxID=3053515 RepID=UPI0025789297|nr:MFS transporter [Variovorax sp. J22P271]MDM0032007.1 MFS transporter [Variovorax sp. J22P271]
MLSSEPLSAAPAAHGISATFNDLEYERGVRRVVRAAAFGTVIEYFDYTAYAFLATTLAKVFFPAADPTAALLYTLGVFGVAFIVRPIGGILLGHLGDRYGRRPALVVSVLGMAFATAAIGFLPTYESVGIAAPLMLLGLRCIQGLSAGGELGGAAAYVAEASPDHRRGYLTSTTQVGTLAGTMLGSLSVALLRGWLTPEQLLDWGWRLPFLMSLPLGLIGLVVRRQMEESRQFEQMEDRGAVSKMPALSVVRTHWRGVLGVFGLSLVSFAAYYLVFTYFATYFERQSIMKASQAAWSTTVTLLFAAFAIPFWGKFTDRVGRKPLLVSVCLANLVLAYPLFMLMKQSALAAFAAQFVLGQIEAAYLGVILAAYCEMFPARVRLSGFSLGYNFAAIVAGGSAPYLATWLIAATGQPHAPAWMLMATALVSLVAAVAIKETAGRPMPVV